MSEFNFKDFILDSSAVTEDAEEKDSSASVAKKPAVKPQYEYNVEWADNCDCIISRTSKRTKVYMVIMLSQNQFYLKDQKGNITPLNKAEYVNFFSKMAEQQIEVNVNWTDSFLKGVAGAERIMPFLEDVTIHPFAKAGMIKLPDVSESGYYYRYRPHLAKEIGNHFNLFRKLIAIGRNEDVSDDTMKKEIYDYLCRSGTLQNVVSPVYFVMLFNTIARNRHQEPVFIKLKDHFGESGVTQLAEMIARQYEGNFYMARRYRGLYGVEENISEILDMCEFKFKTFAEYLTYEPIRQGYDVDTFVQTWLDTLRMQRRVYGKIREKYPDPLAVMHQKMSYQTNILDYLQEQRSIEEKTEKIHERAMRLGKNKFAKDKYMIIIPESVNDILAEAQAQANCLASYVDAFASGKTDIYFMREKKHEEDSLLTIEVRDNRIRQAYGHHNTLPSQEQYDFIETWCKEKHIVFNDSYTPRAV